MYVCLLHCVHQDGCVREISRSVWLRVQWQRGRRFAACPACKGAGSYLLAAKVSASAVHAITVLCTHCTHAHSREHSARLLSMLSLVHLSHCPWLLMSGRRTPSACLHSLSLVALLPAQKALCHCYSYTNLQCNLSASVYTFTY
jgi:hypothetical protein